MTKEQLQAENKALRELLAAARDYASLPSPASHQDPAYNYETEMRLGVLTVYANGDRKDLSDVVYALVLRDRAETLRERAARPLRYKTRDAEPETAGEARCQKPASHGPHLAGTVVDCVIAAHHAADDECRLTPKGEAAPSARCLDKYEHLGNVDYCQSGKGHDGQHEGHMGRRWTPEPAPELKGAECLAALITGSTS